MKKTGILSVLVLTVSLFFLNTSCEIGLGSSVDVDAPTLSISYPGQASVIREEFIVAGDCSDDRGIAEVNLTVQLTDGESAETLKTLQAEVDEVNGRWQASINKWLGEGEGYNGWELPDGSYVINATAVDTSGRESGIVSLSFDIDNTAPIFIIKSPTSKKITSPTSYGTSFKVTGTMTDDHTVSKMVIKIYDDKVDFSDAANPPVPLETIYESNIDTTTEVLVANRNREGYLKDRYETFYEGANEGDNRPLWVTVEMEDNARVYRDPVEAENLTKGNTTDRFYIVDDVNSTWANADKEMDPGKVKKIVNRTAVGIEDNLSTEVMNLFENSYVTKAAFSINSNSNPSYEFRSFGTSINKGVTKAAAADSSVSFSLAPGLNGDNVCPSSVKVFLWGPFDTAATEAQINKMYSSDLSVIEAYAATPDMIDKVTVLAYMGEGDYVLNGKTYNYIKEDGTIDKNGAGGSVQTYDAEITLPSSLSTGKFYYISANALDLVDAIASPAYPIFAFKGHRSGQPPVIKWEDNEFGTNTVADDGIAGDGVITFSGYVNYPDGIEDNAGISFSAKVEEFNGEKNVAIDPIPETVITDIREDQQNKKIYWKFTFEGLGKDSEKLRYYDFTVIARGLGDTQSIQHRRLTIDTQKPTLSITSINPVVKDDTHSYLNGNVNIEAKIQDKNLKKVWYEVYSDNSIIPVYRSPDYGEDTYSLSTSLDTTSSFFNNCDGKELNIVIKAEDKAGNANEIESKIQNNNVNYVLNQEKDKPVVIPNFEYAPASTAKENLDVKYWYSKGSKLNFSLSDDDGLTSVTVQKDEETPASQEIAANTTNASINYALPDADGVYQITLIATDNTYEAATAGYKKYRQTTWGPYTVGVDSKAPILKDENAYTNNYAKDAFTVKGTVSDENGIKAINISVKKDGTEVKTYSLKKQGETEGVDLSGTNWSLDVNKGVLSDGKYTFTTTATDYAGNTNIAESIWTVDTVKPVINNKEITNNAETGKKTIAGNTWYANDKISISVKASDATSGVSDVQYSLDNTNWTSLTAGDVWTAIVNCEQGDNTIYLKAIDEAGMESEVKTLSAKVDTVAPETIDLISVDGVLGFTGVKNISQGTNLSFVVETQDKTPGTDIASVQVTKIGKNNITEVVTTTPDETNGNKYTITIPYGKVPDGSNRVTVTATDNAGNESNPVELFTIEADTTNPEVTINQVSPVVVDGTNNYINGKISISGRIKEDNLSKIWYELYKGEDLAYTSGKNNHTAPSFTFDDIDTTNYSASVDEKVAFKIKVLAEDRAGNEGSAEVSYTLWQNSDKPSINVTNKASDGITWFAANDKLHISVSDDDGLKSVYIKTDKADGTNYFADADKLEKANALTTNIDYQLPSAAGKYKVTIVATDNTFDSATSEFKTARKTEYAPVEIGVDINSPEITETHSTGVNYINASDVTGGNDIKLTGTVSDDNAVTKIDVKVENKTKNTTKTEKITNPPSNWSYTPTQLSDGEYILTATATDESGKTNYVVSSFIRDIVAPTISAKINTKPKTDGWFTESETIEVTASSTDATSGVINVQYSLDNGANWSDFVVTKKSDTEWTAVASIKCDQGTNTIKVKAIDVAGNEKEISSPLTAKVDTVKPETLTLVKVGNIAAADFSGNQMVNGDSDLTFVVEAKDTEEDGKGIGIGSVKVTDIGGTEITGVTAGTPTGSQYTLTIPKDKLKEKSGAVTVTAEDKAGHSTSLQLFTLTYDAEPPVVTISSITPLVTKGEDKFVNGTIKVTAKIVDTYLSNVWYEYKGVKNKVEDTYTSIKQGNVNSIDFTVPTTDYDNHTADNPSEMEIKVWAEDKAGNTSSATVSNLKVDQNTDKPVVTPSNYKEYGTDKTAKDIPAEEWFSATGNNKFIATVTDDDSLKSVKVVAKDKDGTAIFGVSEQELVVAGTTPVSVNVKYQLPSAAGIYQVSIIAEDSTYAAATTNAIKKYRKLEYGPYVVGVDVISPTITEEKSAGTNYITGNFKLKGNVSDDVGIRGIEISAYKEGSSVAAKTYDVTPKADGTWECSVNYSDLEKGKYTFKTIATDYSGKQGTVESIYVKDVDPPKVTNQKVNLTVKDYDSKKWYNTTSIPIEVVATDDASGISIVEYSIDEESSWSPLIQNTTDTTKWTANVTCSQGENKIYIKATDNAGREGKISSEYISVYVDSKIPEFCELSSIDGNEDFNSKVYANGEKDIVLVVTAKDSNTQGEGSIGIKEVVLTKIGKTTRSIKAKPVSGTTDKFEITIPKDEVENVTTTKYIETGAVEVTLYDQFDQNNKFTLFNFDRDETAPTVEVTPIADADDSTVKIDVNGEIVLSGTASDVKELAEVKLYYAVGDTEPAKTWTSPNWKELTNDGSKFAWKGTLKTAELTNNKNLYFYVVAKDSAGNEKAQPYSDTEQLYINQDTDRPRILLSNLALTKEKQNGDETTFETAYDSTIKMYWHKENVLQGSVEDDDGTVKEVYWSKTGAANSWGENIYSRGTWKISGLQEGDKSIYFKVIDAKGTSFESKVSGMKGPKVIDSNEQPCLGYAANANEVLKIKVDVQSPTISEIKAYNSESNTYDASKLQRINALNILGGKNKYFFVKVTSQDTNGIDSVNLTLGNLTAAVQTATKADKTEYVGMFDLSQLTLTENKEIENKTLVVSVKDKAQRETEDSYGITVDNTSPVNEFTTRQNVQLYGSSLNTVMGRIKEASNIEHLWYAVTNTATAPSSSEYTEIKYSVSDEDQIARDNWSIAFDGATTTQTEFHAITLNRVYQELDPSADLDSKDFLDMYLWIKAEDAAGNTSVPSSLHMVVIPNADRPTVEISYPEGDKAVGGNIRVTGTADIGGDDIIEKVYIQIDPDCDGTFDEENWKSELQAIITAHPTCGYEIVSTGKAAPYDYGILVNGTSGWNQTINLDKEFEEKVNGQNRTIGLRVFAIGYKGGKISIPTDKIVPIDPDSPLFGAKTVDGYTDLSLVQYQSGASGTVKSRQKYKDGIYLNGQWYLTGSISDEDSGILNASIVLPNGNKEELISNGRKVKSDWVSEIAGSGHTVNSETYYDYKLNIPVGNTTPDSFAELKYTITIQDASESECSSTRVITVNYDNKAPEFEVTTENQTEIFQSNGTYTLAGTVKEPSSANSSQSGFERVVMYVTNVRSSKTNLVDPMISKGTNSISNREEVTASPDATDGLYWRTATITSAGVKDGAMTVSKIGEANVTEVTPKVRAGGLCKINGVIYRIKTANGTRVTLDDTNVQFTDTTVYFAQGAIVIDNVGTEVNNTAVYEKNKTGEDGKDTAQTGGDGDQVKESVNKSGTTANWSVSIDSTQIRDGEVTVHFVAFDKAGNIFTNEFTATVKNNAPRFVGVKFGSDLDNNSEIDDDEWNLDYADRYVQGRENGLIKSSIEIPDTYRLPIKTKFAVIPQIIGGNTGLTWSMAYTDNNGASKSDGADYNVDSAIEDDYKDTVRNYGTDSEAADYYTKNDDKFKIEYDALKLLKLNSNVGIDCRTGHEEQNLLFTITDKTEGTGINATISLPVKVMVGDSEAPVAKWKPLFWNSSSENSLYNNSQVNGHIELGEEWTTSTSDETEFAKVTNDEDSKVSGIITMAAEVTDNVAVSSITVNVDGTDYTLSKGDSGWTTTSGHLLQLSEESKYSDYFTSTDTNNWYFEFISDKFEKDIDSENYGKNIVKFKFHWNTDKLLANGVHTKPDVRVTVKASDIGPKTLSGDAVAPGTKNTSTPGSDLTTNDAQTDCYQLDVVPYIAKVYTELSALQKREARWSVTSRTSNGAYAVRKTTKDVDGNAGSTETVSFYGFNLTDATYTDGRTSDAVTTSLDNGTKLSSVTGNYDVKTLDISKIMASDTNYSGELKLKVGDVYTLNNLNNNDAKGSYEGELTDVKNGNCGTYGYNRQPNGQNNNKLTDDVRFDIWEINSQAAKPVSGRLEQPVMAINPSTGLIGFAFVDGPNWFSMGGSNQAATNVPYSYQTWLASYDGFTSISYAFDKNGYSYGTGAGGDINGQGAADKFVFVTSRIGKGNIALTNTYNGTNNWRLERIGQLGDSAGNNTGNRYINKQRIKSPSITTAKHSTNTNVYLAYYDSLNDEVRVRYGNFNTNTKETHDDFNDVATGNPAAYTTADWSMLADTAKHAGEYVSIAVISNEEEIAANATASDKLVAVWYDTPNKTLYYSYNDSPTATKANGARGTWSYPIRVFAETSSMAAAGQYVKMVADKNGGIHIAGYDPENQDLCYAYLASPSANAETSSFKTAVVDSKDVVGSNLTIDTVLEPKNGSNVVVPYISYYSTEYVKPMLAYLSDTSKLSSGNLNGAEDDMYTGVWECSLVPTTEAPDMQSKLFNVINVGLWKDASTGVIANSVSSYNPAGSSTTYTTSTITSTTKNNTNGIILGNGTSNAVLGYSVKHGGGSTNIETAQKR